MKAAPPTPAGVIAYLTVRDGEAAIAFYIAAFAAREVYRQMADDGVRVLHARLATNDGIFMLSDDFPEYTGGHSNAPVAGQPRGIVLHLQVADCDAVCDSAVAAGATVLMPPADMFWGDRYARLRDPFGHEWSLGAVIRSQCL
jgi:PhnB protein